MVSFIFSSLSLVKASAARPDDPFHRAIQDKVQIRYPQPLFLPALHIVQVLPRGHNIGLLWFWTCGELLAVSRAPRLTEHKICVICFRGTAQVRFF